MHRFGPALGVAICLAGCSVAATGTVALKPAASHAPVVAPPATPTQANPAAAATQPAPTAAASASAPQEVPPTAVEGIADAAKQAAASALGTQLAVQVRTDRTLRDGELLAGSTLIGQDGASLIGQDGAGLVTHRSVLLLGSLAPLGTPTPTATLKPAAPAPTGLLATILAAFAKLAPAAQQAAFAAGQARDDRMNTVLAAKLKRKAPRYKRQAADAATMATDGSKVVVSSLTVQGAAGLRHVTITRQFDGQGHLLAVTDQMYGPEAADASVSGARVRKLETDGSTVVTLDVSLVRGAQHTDFHWDKRIAPGGAITATGTMTKPDGTKLPLTASGTEDGTETIAGQDAASGIGLQLEAAADAGAATAKLDAGTAGKATLRLDADDEDDDEGAVADRAASH